MLRTNLLGWSGALAASAFLMVACGGATTTQVPGGNSGGAPVHTSASASPHGVSSIDACALITEPEATALIGSDPGPGTKSNGDTTFGCTYGGAVTVSVDRSGSRMLFDGLRSVAQSSGGAGFRDVSGVGDAACLAVIGAGSAVMYIIRGSDLIQIITQAGFSGVTINPDTLAAQGKTALGRI